MTLPLFSYDRGFGPSAGFAKLQPDDRVPILSNAKSTDGRNTASPAMLHGARGYSGNRTGKGEDCEEDSEVEMADSEVEVANEQALHSLVGHKNRAYPIRSAIRVGSEYSRAFALRRANSASDTGTGGGEAGAVAPSLHSTVLVATGSSDGDAFLFDVGGPRGTGELVQRLRGHTDRVYSVDFHPSVPMLATASADFTVKLWAAKAGRRAPRGSARVGL
jgi:WD40 repeat protein